MKNVLRKSNDKMKKTGAALLCLVLLFGLCACGKQEEEPFQPTGSRQDRNAVLQLTDGWYLTYDREESYDADGVLVNTYASLDGVNLKYQNLSDFNIPITDASTGKVVDSVAPAVHFLKLNQTYKDKAAPIDAILEARPNTPDLTLEELQGLDVSGLLFTLEDVVTVYNAAMAGGVKEFGKYRSISSSNIVSDAMLDGYRWQVGYTVPSGHIAALDIELFYDDGGRLSDLDENSLTDSQKELLRTIETVTENILASGNFPDMGIDPETTIDQVGFARLYKILQSIEVENEERAPKKK